MADSADDALRRDVMAGWADPEPDYDHPSPELAAQMDDDIATARDGLFTEAERAEMNPWRSQGHTVDEAQAVTSGEDRTLYTGLTQARAAEREAG